MNFEILARVFICFYLFSIFGHYLEFLWAPVSAKISGKAKFKPLMFTVAPLAMPYGLGAVALTVFLAEPAAHLPLWKVFVLSAILMGAIEYLSAIIIKLIYKGKNPYWDYSGRRFNIQGQVCLSNVLLFGLSGIIFLKLIFPIVEKFFVWLGAEQVEKFGLALIIIFLIDMTYSSIIHFGIDRQWRKAMNLPENWSWTELEKMARFPNINYRLAWQKERDKNAKKTPFSKVVTPWDKLINTGQKNLESGLARAKKRWNIELERPLFFGARILAILITLLMVLIYVLPLIN